MKLLYALSICLFFVMTSQQLSAQEIMLLKTSGKVVIGDTTQISTPGIYNLYVQNGILTEKVKVAIKTTSEWSDDAFTQTPTLQTVEDHINQKSHLPEMPSAASLVETGYSVTEMDANLLQQVEWLWQHMIKLQKENEALKAKLEQLEKTNQ